MDIGDVRGLLTGILLVLFLAVWAWSWSRKRNREFEELGRLPLEEDDDVRPANDKKEQGS